MKKEEILNLHNAINGINAVKGSVKLSYAIIKNNTILKSEVEDLVAFSKEYNEKRNALIKEHYKKDEKGKDILDNGEPVVNMETFNKAVKIFDEEQKEFSDSYKEILKEEVKIKLYKIPLEAFEGLYVIDEKTNKHVDISLSAYELLQFEAIIKE